MSEEAGKDEGAFFQIQFKPLTGKMRRNVIPREVRLCQNNTICCMSSNSRMARPRAFTMPAARRGGVQDDEDSDMEKDEESDDDADSTNGLNKSELVNKCKDNRKKIKLANTATDNEQRIVLRLSKELEKM